MSLNKAPPILCKGSNSCAETRRPLARVKQRPDHWTGAWRCPPEQGTSRRWQRGSSQRQPGAPVPSPTARGKHPRVSTFRVGWAGETKAGAARLPRPPPRVLAVWGASGGSGRAPSPWPALTWPLLGHSLATPNPLQGSPAPGWRRSRWPPALPAKQLAHDWPRAPGQPELGLSGPRPGVQLPWATGLQREKFRCCSHGAGLRNSRAECPGSRTQRVSQERGQTAATSHSHGPTRPTGATPRPPPLPRAPAQEEPPSLPRDPRRGG